MIYSSVCSGGSVAVASVNVFIGLTELNSAGAACVTTFHAPRQSFYSIVLLSPGFLSPAYTAKRRLKKHVCYFSMIKSDFFLIKGL